MLQLFTSTHNGLQQRKSAIITKRMLAGRSDYIYYNHGGTFVLWGPALVGNSIFNTNCAPGEFVITLEGLCKSRMKGNVQRGGPRPKSATWLSILTDFLRLKAIPGAELDI